MKLDAKEVTVELQARRIIEDVTLTVTPGEIVGLIGPNGSGKSTFLRTVYRLLPPTAGQVFVGGSDVWRLSARESARRTGVVVQESPSEFEFTVHEMVRMGRMPHKALAAPHNRHDDAVVNEALRRVAMFEFSGQSFSVLSGGEKQRVLIARALAQQPKLLVMDEVTNHLDIHYQFEILDLVKELGTTTLITLHDLNLAAAYCNRLYVLCGGCIVAQGRPEEVLTPTLLRRVFQIDAVIERHPITGQPYLAFIPLNKSKASARGPSFPCPAQSETKTKPERVI